MSLCALDACMAGSLQLINVVVDSQTFTGLYRVNDGVLTLKFAGRELVALIGQMRQWWLNG